MKRNEAVKESTMRNTTAKCVIKEVVQGEWPSKCLSFFFVVAKEDTAFFKTDSLRETLSRCGAPVLTNYRNNHSVAELATCLADVSRDQMTKEVIASPFFNVLIDESELCSP